MSDVEKIAALGISLTGLGGTIVFQTHVAQDVSVEELNGLVDRWQKVIARQQAIVDLVSMKKNLKQNETQLMRMREDRNRIDAAMPQEGRRNPNRGDAAKAEQMRAQADANEKRYMELIQEARAEIVEVEALIANEG